MTCGLTHRCLNLSPAPAGWHDVKAKKVSCSLVAPHLGKASLILDRQLENECFYDLSKEVEENATEKTPFKVSYGGQDACSLSSDEYDEGSDHPLLNIVEGAHCAPDRTHERARHVRLAQAN